MYSPEESARILMLRAKVNNNTITKEEITEAFVLLRKAREGAHAASATSRATKSATAAKKNINSDDLLSELD